MFSDNNLNLNIQIECSIPKDKAWSMNLKRSESIRYSENVFDGLYFRYEAPDSRNRWDSPYFLFTPESQSNFEDIYEAIFVNKPLKPNKSTLPVSILNGILFKVIIFFSLFFIL